MTWRKCKDSVVTARNEWPIREKVIPCRNFCCWILLPKKPSWKPELRVRKNELSLQGWIDELCFLRSPVLVPGYDVTV